MKSQCVFNSVFPLVGIKFRGGCFKDHFDNKGKKIESEDLTQFMQAEGGVVCATVLVVLLFLRLPRLVAAKRTKQLPQVSLEERKKFDGLIFFACFALYVASFGVCVAGMSVSLFNGMSVCPSLCHSVFLSFILFSTSEYIILVTIFFRRHQNHTFVQRCTQQHHSRL